jgi:phage shock protein C
MNDRLYRSVDDRMVLGVLCGISLRLGMDPSIIRVIYAVVTVLSGIFPLVIAYAIMAFVIPEAPPGSEASLRAAAGRGSGAAGPTGWGTEAGSAAGAAGADASGSSASASAGWGAGPATGAAGAAATGAAAGAGAAPAWGTAWDATGEAAGTAGRHGRDPRAGAIVGGLVLLGLGLLFLLVQVVPDLDWGVVGPVALVGLGIVLILGSVRRA